MSLFVIFSNLIVHVFFSLSGYRNVLKWRWSTFRASFWIGGSTTKTLGMLFKHSLFWSFAQLLSDLLKCSENQGCDLIIGCCIIILTLKHLKKFCKLSNESASISFIVIIVAKTSTTITIYIATVIIIVIIITIIIIIVLLLFRFLPFYFSLCWFSLTSHFLISVIKIFL